MGTACSRVEERVLASIGELTDASAKFEASKDVSYGGLLFALPALLASGLLKNIQDYFKLPDGYYSIRQMFLVLGLTLLLRVKSIERIKYLYSGELGKLLGLDRIPEIRTIRRKMDYLGEYGKGRDWSLELSRDWMEEFPEIAGVLYVDGHVRVYYGEKVILPRRYVSRYMTDYWINDIYGQPFFVIRSPFNDGLLSTLKREIVPRLLQDVPGQPSLTELEDNKLKYRFLLVF